MGISSSVAERISEITKLIRQSNGDDYSINSCSLGHPDILIDETTVKKLQLKQLKGENEDRANKIRSWHGKDKEAKIYSAKSFFQSLGSSLSTFDIRREYGDEIELDLNQKMITRRYHNTFDFVYDNGTIEHCFHAGQALINAASMVKQGGYIYHQSPFNIFNHGFWGMNPTLFNDFYKQSGFRILYINIESTCEPRLVANYKIGNLRIPWNQILGIAKKAGKTVSDNGEYLIHCVAERIKIKSLEEQKYCQSKYQENLAESKKLKRGSILKVKDLMDFE